MLNARFVLLKFFDQLSEVDEYEKVNKDDFWELKERFRNQRSKGKEVNKLKFQKKFHSEEASLKKCASIFIYIQ